MSELDDARRRLLVAQLAGAGQAIITTTNRHYFTDAELAAATVIELPLADAPDGRRGRAGRQADRTRRTENDRGEPRKIGEILDPALARLDTSDQARAYGAWARAAGDAVAANARPRSFARGVLTVECASSIWAQELTYLGGQLLARMNELDPAHPVERFRFVTGVARARAEPPGGAPAGSLAAGERACRVEEVQT